MYRGGFGGPGRGCHGRGGHGHGGHGYGGYRPPRPPRPPRGRWYGRRPYYRGGCLGCSLMLAAPIVLIVAVLFWLL